VSSRYRSSVGERGYETSAIAIIRLSGLIATIDSRLETNGFFNPAPGKTETARWMLRNVLTRPGFTGAEVQFLRGVVRHLVQPRRPS
jgi:tRNA/rRNA methyltransferase